jgi:hypothetical protein
MRPPRFAQRKDAIDYRREFARVDDLRDLSELRAVRLRANADDSSERGRHCRAKRTPQFGRGKILAVR